VIVCELYDVAVNFCASAIPQKRTSWIPGELPADYYDKNCAQQAVIAAEKRVATNTANRLPGGRNEQRCEKLRDCKTDHPAEYQKNRDAINTANNLAGGRNEKLRDFKTDHPAEHQKNRDAINTANNLAGGRNEQLRDCKTDHPAEYQKNRDAINTANNLAGGRNEKLRASKLINR
jgi:hypothetical protein